MCADVDECAAGAHDCWADANCRNLVGGWSCSETPAEGYQAGDQTCIQVQPAPEGQAQNDCLFEAVCCPEGLWAYGDGSACTDAAPIEITEQNGLKSFTFADDSHQCQLWSNGGNEQLEACPGISADTCAQSVEDANARKATRDEEQLEAFEAAHGSCVDSPLTGTMCCPEGTTLTEENDGGASLKQAYASCKDNSDNTCYLYWHIWNPPPPHMKAPWLPARDEYCDRILEIPEGFLNAGMVVTCPPGLDNWMLDTCARQGVAVCALWGTTQNRFLPYCQAYEPEMVNGYNADTTCTRILKGWPGQGTRLCCPEGRHTYGDGSACVATETKPACALYGNAKLPRCAAHDVPEDCSRPCGADGDLYCCPDGWKLREDGVGATCTNGKPASKLKTCALWQPSPNDYHSSCRRYGVENAVVNDQGMPANLEAFSNGHGLHCCPAGYKVHKGGICYNAADDHFCGVDPDGSFPLC